MNIFLKHIVVYSNTVTSYNMMKVIWILINMGFVTTVYGQGMYHCVELDLSSFNAFIVYSSRLSHHHIVSSMYHSFLHVMNVLLKTLIYINWLCRFASRRILLDGHIQTKMFFRWSHHDYTCLLWCNENWEVHRNWQKWYVCIIYC